MPIKWIYCLVLAGVVAAASSKAFAKDQALPELNYETFVELVEAQHPEKALDQMRLSKVKEAELRAGILSDPQLSLGRDQVPLPRRYQKEPSDAIDKGSAEWQVGLSQSFPWPGTLAAETHAARAQTSTAENDVKLSTTLRGFEAKELFLRLVRLAKTIEVQKASLKVVESTRDYAREKFKQGSGSHMEFLQTHSESGILKVNLRAMETDLLNLKQHALLLLDWNDFSKPESAHFALEWPKDLPSVTSQINDPGSADTVRNRIVLMKDATRARQNADYDRTLPSFTASGMLMREDSGMRMYAATIGVSLPLYSSISRRSFTSESSIIEAEAASAVSWHDRRKDLALMQAESRKVQIEANLNLLRQEVIPPLKEHLESAVVQFSQGKADINTIIQGQRALLDLSVTEITTTEALALARLAVEKIHAGLIDAVLDLEIPQVSGIGGRSMNTGSSNMEGPSTMQRKPMKNIVPSKAPVSENEEPSESAPKGNMPGM